MPDLVTSAEVLTAISTLTPAQQADLPAVVSAASAALDSYCDRRLASATYDEVVRVGYRAAALALREYPVTRITRFAGWPTAALSITNTDTATNQRAWVTFADDGQEEEPTYTGLTLSRVASGVQVDMTFPFSADPTLAALAAAVNALGVGWSATVAAGLGDLGSAELWPSRRLRNALQGTAANLVAFVNAAACTDVDNRSGLVRFSWPNSSTGYLASTGASAWGLGGWEDGTDGDGVGASPPWGAWGAGQGMPVRITYTAGYVTVPADLKRIAIMTVKSMLDQTPFPGSFTMERTSSYTYQQNPSVSIIPGPCRMILDKKFKRKGV